MNTTTKRAVCVAAVVALANWASLGADMGGTPGGPGTGSPRSTDQDSSQQTTTPRQRDTGSGSYNNMGTGTQSQSAAANAEPQDYNKASDLIGMDVQNQQGEHLGHIKDIVIDLNSQRVSYAVLTTAPKALPIDEKLLAVPLNAFSVSADQKHLVLNADKSKVDAAAGFSSKNWPNVGNPTWGAQPFWQQNNNQSGPEQHMPR